MKSKVLWAKKSKTEAGELWLPLPSHMSDSAETARFVWNHWAPTGIKKVISSGISLPAKETGNEDFAEQLFVFLAAAHDLGKATPVFQAKESFVSRHMDILLHQSIRNAGLPLKDQTSYSERAKSHHSIASHAILRRCGLHPSVAVVLGAHHGKPPGHGQLQHLQAYSDNIGFDNEIWRKLQEDLLDYALAFGGISRPMAQSVVLQKPAQVILSGLIILVDWIASDENLFPLIELHENNTHCVERARHAWEALSLTPNWCTDRDWDQLYAKRFGIQHPRAIQEEVLRALQNCLTPGMLIVEAPMGEGKTEAALAAAEIMAANTGRAGIYFALPTQTTSDAMLSRVCNWIDRIDSYGGMHSILLAHGKADFNPTYRKIKLSETIRIGEAEDAEMYESVIVHEWLSGRKKSILADFAIGTIDHVLMAGLKCKHLMLRHLGLANKVVIIDECHAYDAYMSQYLKIVLKWLGAYRVPVIILSATLPVKTRRALIEAYLNKSEEPQADPEHCDPEPMLAVPKWAQSREYPLITFTDGHKVIQKSVSGKTRSLSISIRRIPDNSVADTLEHMLSTGGCAGVIVNTVSRAQRLYKELAERFGKDCTRLVHSRYISTDRAAKEGELQMLLGPPSHMTNRPDKLIVIGTQVLEQSLDIDFDLLVSDISPMDLLIQRLGRLHRHERPRPHKLKDPVCLIPGIIEDAFERGSEAIYGKYLLMRTKALLPEKIILPGAIASLVQDTYAENDHGIPIDPSILDEYEAAKEEHRKRISNKESKAKTFQVSDPLRSLPDLVGWLDTVVEDSTGKRGEATVRDAADSLEVILAQKTGTEVRFLPWMKYYKGQRIPRDYEPDEEMARALVGCGVRLPSVFGAPWMINRVVTELENRCRDGQLELWQKSRWLKGELFLLLDENLETSLCGYRLKYDRHLGLISEKVEA